MSSARSIVGRPEIIAAPRNADLFGKSPDYLYAEFDKCLVTEIGSLIRRGDILLEFKNQGVLPDKNRLGKFALMCKSLMGLADGSILPDTFTRFYERGYTGLFKIIASLSVLEQLRLIQDESVDLAIPKSDGGFEVMRVMPEDMSREQIAQVFHGNQIVDAERQMQAAKFESVMAASTSKFFPVGNIVINKATGKFKTKGWITPEEFAEAASYFPTAAKRKGGA